MWMLGMSKKPNLDAIEKQLQKGNSFSLTDESYNRKTGAWLPMSKTYIEKDLALAKQSKRYGFKVTVIQQK